MAATLGHFNFLPNELLCPIFDLISICEKKKARLVCRRWCMVIDNLRSVAFRPKLTNNTSMKYFLNCYCSMNHVIIRNINMRISDDKVYANSEFPRVKNAELGWKNSEGNIERFLSQGCKYADSLTLAKFSLERISRGGISKTLPKINWENLTRFNFVVTTSNHKDERARKHLRNVSTVLRYARIPILQAVAFNFDFRYGFGKKHILQYQMLFMGLYSFLVVHSKTLKMLTGRIDSTSRRKLEIPGIPSLFQQSLVSNMKLEQFSLSLWGVRRFESIINPVICGTQLKTLELKNFPSSGKFRVPPYLVPSALALTPNFIQNLEQIFEKNAKTLIEVSLKMYINSGPFLEKCTALESLKLEDPNLRYFEESEELSHIRLKSFSTASSSNVFSNTMTHLCPGLYQLLRQSVGTLEHLSLFQTHDILWDHIPQFWLSDCIALKSLKIRHIWKAHIDRIRGGQMPNLIELETYMDIHNRHLTATWIKESMPNLEMITITGTQTNVEFLRTLLTIPKLKQIILADTRPWGNDPLISSTEEIKEFCAIPGVIFKTVKDGRKIGHDGKMHIITVNSSPVVYPIMQ